MGDSSGRRIWCSNPALARNPPPAPGRRRTRSAVRHAPVPPLPSHCQGAPAAA
jgi:hypothetical protein